MKYQPASTDIDPSARRHFLRAALARSGLQPRPRRPAPATSTPHRSLLRRARCTRNDSTRAAGRPTLQPADRGQLVFQAPLFECLMSTREDPHLLSSTTTPASAASPASGPIGVTFRRVRMVPVPTGARLEGQLATIGGTAQTSFACLPAGKQLAPTQWALTAVAKQRSHRRRNRAPCALGTRRRHTAAQRTERSRPSRASPGAVSPMSNSPPRNGPTGSTTSGSSASPAAAAGKLSAGDPRTRGAGHGHIQELATLRKLRCSTTRITIIVKVVLAQQFAGQGPIGINKVEGTLILVADVKVTYDKSADAYAYFADPQVRVARRTCNPCDPSDVGDMINLDFEEQAVSSTSRS